MLLPYRIRQLHGNFEEKKQTILKSIKKKSREFRNKREIKKLKNNDFTIISNMCVGGIMYHDLGLEFQSPTVNLYIRAVDFVKFCNNIKYYLNFPLIELPWNSEIGYPVATLNGEITVYFKHYRTFDEANDAWERRKKRINWDHICFIMVDRDIIPPVSKTGGAKFCGEKTIKGFNDLPYKNKVCFVKDPKLCKKYDSCSTITKGCDADCVGVITDIVSISGKRMYQFIKGWDYIDFLNQI